MNIKFTFSKTRYIHLDTFPFKPQHTSDRMCDEYTNLPSIQLDILYHQYPNDRNKIDLEQGQNFRSSVSTIISLRRRKGIRIYLKLNWRTV